jgi:DNA-binding transcriptional regulator YiaG
MKSANEKHAALVARLRKERLEGKIKPRITSVVLRYPEMKKEEFTSIRKALKLTQGMTAQIISTSIRAIQAYEQGVCSVPGPVARIMRLMHSNPTVRYFFFQDLFAPLREIRSEIRTLTFEINKIQSKSQEVLAAESRINTLVNRLQTDALNLFGLRSSLYGLKRSPQAGVYSDGLIQHRKIINAFF